jgi:hypothetical protein
VWAIAPSCWNQRVCVSTPSLCNSGSRNVHSFHSLLSSSNPYRCKQVTTRYRSSPLVKYIECNESSYKSQPCQNVTYIFNNNICINHK